MSNVSLPGEGTQNQPIGQPCLGLFLDRPSHTIDPRGLEDCNNVRIEQGRIHADLMGYSTFLNTTLNGPVTLIDTFYQSIAQEHLIFGTPTDLYRFINNGTVAYITPVYNTGTISVSNGSTTVTGTGTAFNTAIGGNSTTTAAADAVAGATSIILSSVPSNLAVGQLVGSPSNPAAIQPSTQITSILGTAIQISKPLAFALHTGDTLRFGGANFRNNVRVGDEIAFTSNAENSPSAPWYVVASVQSDTSITLSAPYTGSTLTNAPYTVRQKSYPWDTTSVFGLYLPHWETETFPQAGAPWNKDMWFATNGADPLIAWDGQSTFAQYVTTVPFISTCIRRYKNMMIYGGLCGSNGQLLPTSIANSDNGTPTIVAGGVAFQGVASDGPYVINHIGVLGNVLMLYMGGATGGTVTSATFVGFPNIWAFSEVIRGRGPVAGRLVAEFPDRHQFIAMDGQYRYNGIFIQVMNDHIWRNVMKRFDYSRAAKAFCTINPIYGDIHWGVPLQGNVGEGGGGGANITTAYTEHYMEQANSFLFKPYTKRDFTFTAAGFWPDNYSWKFSDLSLTSWISATDPWNTESLNPPFPWHLVGDATGHVYSLYSSDTQNGAIFTSYVTYPKRLIDNGGRSRALVKRVYPFVETSTITLPLQITLMLYDSVSGPMTIADTQSFQYNYPATSDGTVYRYTVHYRRGRVGQVQILSNGDINGQPWILDGYDWDWVPGGLR